MSPDLKLIESHWECWTLASSIQDLYQKCTSWWK